MSRLSPVTRQATGQGYVHYAYACNAQGTIVLACSHKHRSQRTAQRCAESMVRRREAAKAS